MTTKGPGQTPPADTESEGFIRGLLDHAANIRLPELFKGEQPKALYHLPNRHGVSVVALRTASLSQDQLIKIMTYRLAQYVAIGFVDPQMVYKKRMEHEPLSDVSPDEVHIVAGSAETGEILCSVVFKGRIRTPAAGTTIRMIDRPLFPVEKLFGCGVYNRLKILPDLPVSKVRELGHLVKNQQLAPFDELVSRAPVEVCFAVFQLLIGPLRQEVDACIGDIEEGVAKKNMDFFHVPLVVLHGVIPYSGEEAYLQAHVQSSPVYPFALLVSDLSMAKPRLAAIKRALNLPGKQGIVTLLNLKRSMQSAKSSLEPPEGLATLTDTAIPQQGMSMQARREMLDLGRMVG